MYFNVCKNCGANLDPGEKCDCREEKQKRLSFFENVFSEDSDGQMVIGGLFDGRIDRSANRDG